VRDTVRQVQGRGEVNDLEKKGRQIVADMLMDGMPLIIVMGALNKCTETFGTQQEKDIAIAIDHVVAIMFPIGKK
jgi:hypothetical protein